MSAAHKGRIADEMKADSIVPRRYVLYNGVTEKRKAFPAEEVISDAGNSQTT